MKYAEVFLLNTNSYRPQSTEAGSHIYLETDPTKSQLEFCLQVAAIAGCGLFSPLPCTPLKWSHFLLGENHEVNTDWELIVLFVF